jgi:hypothetical protein
MTITAPPALDLRDGTLGAMYNLLEEQYEKRADIIQTAQGIRAEDGRLIISAATQQLQWDQGVTSAEGIYDPTAICDEGIAEKLDIPLAYLRRTRQILPHLWDQNVNGWLERTPNRKFLIRTFPGTGGAPGIARAFLSDKYQIIDNFDVLTAAFAGIKAAGVEVDIMGCDLTERRMHVRAVARNLDQAAPRLLHSYRAPSGDRGADNPMVGMGVRFMNSELGAGAFQISPYVVIRVCTNGLTVPNDAMRVVHLGAGKDVGTIRWSHDTNRRHLDLITSKTTDAIKAFLQPRYLSEFIAGIEDQAATPLRDPENTITTVCKQLKFTDEQRAEIFADFIRGGDVTAGGVMQAVTSVSQRQPSGDTAADMEAHALQALALAASL